MPLFGAYLMVDWSASAKPRHGRHSIWACLLERDREPILVNPPDRDAAVFWIADRLGDLAARGRRVLCGFDFSFGYPRGFAARLDPRRPDWSGVWRQLAGRVSKNGDRFAVAETLATEAGAPFWGRPVGRDDVSIPISKSVSFNEFAEFRLCERQARGSKSVWQLYGAGSVGSQTLTGLPRLHELRHWQGLEDVTRIWPFETGLKVPDEGARVVFAEVYPSLVARGRPDNEQVLALARHFAELDGREALAPMFTPSLPEAEQAVVQREEGWILGVPHPGPPLGGEGERRAHPLVGGDGGATLPHYIRDPAEIYRLSWQCVRAATDLSGIPADLKPLAERLVHTAGDPAIVADLAFGRQAGKAGRKALAGGAPILCDVEMVAQGITRSRLAAGNQIICFLNAAGVRDRAAEAGITRAMAAVDLWLPRLEGAVVAIGNAPTALFRLLELLHDGAPRPALILGFPVGFVGAAESKEALIRLAGEVPYVTLKGRRGGSAMAAAAVNALAGDQS